MGVTFVLMICFLCILGPIYKNKLIKTNKNIYIYWLIIRILQYTSIFKSVFIEANILYHIPTVLIVIKRLY